MNKKITSLVIALTMLMQTAVSASSLLSTHVSTKPNYAAYLDGGLFSYTKFNQILGQSPEKVMPNVNATVSLAGADSFAEHTSLNPLYGSNFDFRVELDMTPVKTAFSSLYQLGRNVVLASEPTNQAALQSNFDNSKVTGQFVVNVTFPSGLTPAVTPSASNLDFKQRDASGNLVTPSKFEVTDVTIGVGTMQVTFAVIDQPGSPLRFIDINNSMDILNNLVVTIPNVQATIANTLLSVTTTMDGKSTFADPDDAPSTGYTDYGFIEYDSDDTHNLSAVYYNVPTVSGGSGISKPTPTPPATPPVKPDDSTGMPSITVIVDNKSALHISEGDLEQDEYGNKILDLTTLEKPEKEGFVFAGWYDSPQYNNEYEDKIIVDKEFRVYARFVNVTPPEQMISDDHILYIVGYPDGEVKPENNITREEVVAALYRLLKPAYRDEIETNEHDFPDVDEDRWSNNEIATMYNGGYLTGDENGNFDPSRPITRAEFVTLITRFAPMEVEPYDIFSDIKGHWAEQYISQAVALAWISGYEDGTFRPDELITRAEAMTIINRMLVRYGDPNDSHKDMWPDVDESDWFYTAVIEATTNNSYVRNEDGWTESWNDDAQIIPDGIYN